MKQTIIILISILIGLIIGYIDSLGQKTEIELKDKLIQAQENYINACEELLDSIAINDFKDFSDTYMETEIYAKVKCTKMNLIVLQDNIEDNE